MAHPRQPGTPSEASTELAAPAEDVMAVIADVESYPDWVGSITSTEVLETETVVNDAGEAEERPRVVRVALSSGPLTDVCTLRLSWPDALSVEWRLLEATLLRAMTARFDLEPLGEDTTTVTFTLGLDAALPPDSPLQRTAEEWIIDRALRGLRRRVVG